MERLHHTYTTVCFHCILKVLEETMKLSHYSGADLSQQFGLVLCAAGKEKVACSPIIDCVCEFYGFSKP